MTQSCSPRTIEGTFLQMFVSLIAKCGSRFFFSSLLERSISRVETLWQKGWAAPLWKPLITLVVHRLHLYCLWLGSIVSFFVYCFFFIYNPVRSFKWCRSDRGLIGRPLTIRLRKPQMESFQHSSPSNSAYAPKPLLRAMKIPMSINVHLAQTAVMLCHQSHCRIESIEVVYEI